MIGVRLQGGPFDGDRQQMADLLTGDLPATLWVARRADDPEFVEWFADPVDGAEVYGRDEEDEHGWLIYLYTDEDAERHLKVVEAVSGAGQ
jgi:hypothetical protein